jgi:replication initiation and membrane attachment protein DnaB
MFHIKLFGYSRVNLDEFEERRKSLKKLGMLEWVYYVRPEDPPTR